MPQDGATRWCRLAALVLPGALAVCLGGRIAAAEDRAVSAPTVSVDGSAGSLGGSPSGYFSATGTVPVGDRFGFQLDGETGQSGDRGEGGGGAHLFWRDPGYGLAGATALWSRVGGWNIFRYGVETEAYLGDFTVAPSAGLQRGDANKGTSSSGFGSVDLSWYLRDDLKLSLGGAGFSNVRTGFAGIEWQPSPTRPLTLFANGGGGDHGPGFALVGLRYTFGAPGSSLKDRNRHGDPENLATFTNVGGGGGGALVTQAHAIHAEAAAPVAVPTAAPRSSGSGGNGGSGGSSGGNGGSGGSSGSVVLYDLPHSPLSVTFVVMPAPSAVVTGGP